MTFRSMGQKEFERFVEYNILQAPSVHVPKHRKRLRTFSERKPLAKRVSDVEKERKLQIQCWKKRMAFACKTRTVIENTFEQYVELPRALVDKDGLPQKGQKSSITWLLESRYSKACRNITTNVHPTQWVADAVVIDGMFLLHISPWGHHKTMSDYANFLAKQHILPHFARGSKEVHLIFDDPGRHPNSPKAFERARRSAQAETTHSCITFNEAIPTPKRWQESILTCHRCKRGLVSFLATYLVDHISNSLRTTQLFVTAGGFEGSLQDEALAVQQHSLPQPDPKLCCNAEEADTRI